MLQIVHRPSALVLLKPELDPELDPELELEFLS